MIVGIGSDIIEIKRVWDKIIKENGFREAVFSLNEINYCESKLRKEEHYAARFAAKEAFFKALGTGIEDITGFSEIEIVHNKQGKPEFSITGNIATYINKLNINHVHVSISHIKEFAHAMVVMESNS